VAADSGGKLVFRFQPDSATSAGVLWLDCVAPGGALTRRPLAFEGAPAGAGEADGDSTPSGTVALPALADPDALAQEELVARGYPRRPDAAKNPRAYEAWRGRVRRGLKLAPPGTNIVGERPRGERQVSASGDASNFNAANWSGCIQEASYPLNEWLLFSYGPTPYVLAYGQVTAAPLGNLESSTTTAAAAWIGMGGFWRHSFQCQKYGEFFLCSNEFTDNGDNGNTPIIQAGAESQGIYVLGMGHAVKYFAWYEYEVPQPAGDPHVGWVQSFDVSPGDSLFVVAEATDANGNVDPSAPYATFSMFDLADDGLATTVTYAQPPTTQAFYGETFEAIMERPRFNGVNADIAQYGTSTMWVEGEVQNGSPTSPTETLNMVASGKLLSTGAISGTSCVNTWVAY